MNIKDVIETEILSNGMDGEGIARIDGKVVFIPYTLKGERVRAVIKQVKKKYATASVIKILQPSEHRITPDCPHYYKCGGCDMGHISSEYRREILLDELKNNLKKIAGIDYTPKKFIEWDRYHAARNKLSMPFGIVGGKIVLGFYRQNTHVVEPVDCTMSDEATRKIAAIVCEFANAKKLSVYSDKTGSGLLRHLVIRKADRCATTLVINSDSFEGERELGEKLKDVSDFFVSPNTKRNNVIMGDSVRLVSGNPALDVNVMGIKAELSPLSFFQVNDDMRDKLYAAAQWFIKSDCLIDLYSGIGITSNLAAQKCGKVIAVECVERAVKDADKTAALNGNSNKITNICGDVEKVLPTLDLSEPHDVLVDPPRKGCGAAVMRAIAENAPERLIYISCNHATMCRDIKVFLDVKPEYKLLECIMMDMFPNTHHSEVFICFEKIGK